MVFVFTICPNFLNKPIFDVMVKFLWEGQCAVSNIAYDIMNNLQPPNVLPVLLLANVDSPFIETEDQDKFC